MKATTAARGQSTNEAPENVPGGAQRARQVEVDATRGEEDSRGASHPGARRAAIFVLSLEEEVASQLLRCLDDEELGVIAAEIAGLGLIEKETVNAVLREFRELEELQDIVSQRGVGDAIRLARASFHAEKAERVCELLQLSRRGKPFAALEDADLERLAACLRKEHPQTRALVLAHLPPARAAAILKGLDVDEREDLLERIDGLRSVETEVLARLAGALAADLREEPFESVPFESAREESACDDPAATDPSPPRAPRARGADGARPLGRARGSLASFESMLEGATTTELDRVVHEVAVEDLAAALRGLPRELQGRVFARLAHAERETFCRVAERDADVDEEDVALARAEVARALLEPPARGVPIGSFASEAARAVRERR